MPNAIVKNVLVSLILVVLCVVIGTEAAESRQVAIGIIAALVGGCFLLWLGPRCWVLIYLLPPVMALLPLPGKLAQIPIPFLASLVVLIYWFIMWGMGYVKFRWRGFWVFDLLVLAILLYMVASFIRNPVTLAVLGWDAETVGGREYVHCILASVYYLTVSCIPCTYEQAERVLKWAVRLSIIACLWSLFMRLSGYMGNVEGLQDAAANSRFSMFYQLGLYGIYVIYGQHPISKVLFTPRFVIGLMLSGIGILLCGWREKMLFSGCVTVALSAVKREFCAFLLVLLSIYGALLYLSKEDLVQELPYGIQRSISVLPGIKVSAEVEYDTSHSTEWRKEMWSWALDPRTRYIEDYVWGDGFGISVDWLRRETIAAMREGVAYNLREQLARTGEWHNGAITAIHRLGYVGLSLIFLMYLFGTIMAIRVCQAVRGSALYLPGLFLVLPYTGEMPYFFISAGTIPAFFRSYAVFAMIKFFYCIARERGIIVPWYLHQRYVPMAIKEHEAVQQLPLAR